MPRNKSAQVRMSVIIEMMRRRVITNSTTFVKEMKRRDTAGQYSISAKTFSRDIHDLKTDFGAPLEYDASAHSYFLRDPEWFCESLMVQPLEMKGLVLGQIAAEALMPEPIREKFKQAMTTLLTRNPADLHDNVALETMQIINPLQLPISAEIFSAVLKGWEKSHKLQLTYCSSRGAKHEIEFEPHVLAWQGGIWYLKGKSADTAQAEGEKYRGSVLAVHRITQANMLPVSFDRDAKILDSVKKGKLFEFARYPEVRLQFLPTMALQRVRERFSNSASSIQEEADGSLLVTLQNLTEYQVAELAVWAWGRIKVLAPEELRQEILNFGENLLKNQQ